MDGIDGLAGIQAITTFLISSFFFLQSGEMSLMTLNLCLGFATMGFLVWNFPVSKIFMGDSCAYFLGLIIGLFSLVSHTIDMHLFWCYMIMMAVFITDTTFTLFYRLINREKFYLAHRTHVYQLLSIKYNSHLVITLGVLFINILWLFPISYLFFIDVLGIISALLLAYIPIFTYSLFFRLKNK